jgi:hypothetical protein
VSFLLRDTPFPVPRVSQGQHRLQQRRAGGGP